MTVVMRVAQAEPPTYVRDYDLDAHAPGQPYPTGQVRLTEDTREAKRFPSLHAALEAWREPSQAVPLRPDGEPNRPLTAFTMTFERAPDDG
jgi:hypothetical protein